MVAPVSPLDVSSTVGLGALVALSTNVWLGVFVRAKTRIPARWQSRLPRALSLFKLHKWTGYSFAALVLLHVALIPFDPTSGFRWFDVFLPAWTPHQPVVSTLGAASLYLLGVVVVSSYFQRRIGYRSWRKLHYLTVVGVPLVLVHGLLTDPLLKDRPVDFLDAEKVLVEACMLAVVLAAVTRLRRPTRVFPALVLGFLLPAVARAADPPADGWSLDPDAGLVARSGDLRFATWGYAQGVFALDVPPYFRRVRQGAELDLPRWGPVRAIAVYEVDFTDNAFFQSGAAWKVWENAFLEVQNAGDGGRFRVLYGENTHILSREDNLGSGNLPTINRSIILEDHGSIHAFGTQWGGQVSGRPTDRIALAASVGDNRGSLNQDTPYWSPANDFAGKATWTAWKGSSGSALSVGAAGDYTRAVVPGTFTLATALAGAPVLATPADGGKATFEADVGLTPTQGAGFPVAVEAEWIGSTFPTSGTWVQGGYVQGMGQLYGSAKVGDLWVFARPELALMDTATAHASLVALRGGLDWNVPFTAQRANLLLEGAWHGVHGDPAIVVDGNPGAEVRLMLRVSATRHNRR